MPAGRPHGPNDPSLLSSLETAVREVRRPGPVELAWNWRWELGIPAALAVSCWLIASTVGLLGLSVTAGAGLAAIAAALLLWPPARHWCISRAWCIITPHRVRAGCESAWVQTRSGKLPFILSTTPMARGELVRLWLRAGLTAADLHAARDVLAAACWATEVRVVRSPSRAHLVALEVIRTRHPERLQPTPEAWPFLRRGAGDGSGDVEGRDTPRSPGDAVPAPRFSRKCGRALKPPFPRRSPFPRPLLTRLRAA
jgi:hypothetical protein